MRRRGALALPAFLTLLVLGVLPGCSAMDIDATALEPHVYLNRQTADGDAPDPVAEFEARTRGSWLLWGLVELDEPEVGEALEREIARAGGGAATNVVVVTRQTFLDGFLGVLTLGIYTRRSTFVRGTVVR